MNSMLTKQLPSSYAYGKSGGVLRAIGFSLIVIFIATLLGAAIPILGLFAVFFTVFAAFSLWVFLDFRVGVALSMVFMPLSATVLFPHELAGIRGLNPLNLILIATALSYFVHAGFNRWRDPLIPSRLIWWYVLPIAIAAVIGMSKVSLIPHYFEAHKLIEFTDRIGYIRDMFLKPQFLVFLSILVALAVRHSHKPERFIYLMLVSGWIFCGLIIWLIARSGASLAELASPDERAFLSALGMHANELSLLLNMLYAITLFSIRDGIGGTKKVFLFVSAILFGAVVLLTFSRGGFAGFFVINILYFRTRISLQTVLLGLVVALGLGYFILDAFLERALTGVETGNRGAITAGRIDDIWLPLLPYVLADPILPHGIFSILWSEPIRLNRMLPFGQTHSAWLGGLMDFGLIGFGFMIAFLLYVRKEFLRLAREHVSPALQGLFAGGAVTIPVWFVQGLTDDHFTPTFSQPYFWMALGILMGCGGVFRARARVTGAQ